MALAVAVLLAGGALGLAGRRTAPQVPVLALVREDFVRRVPALGNLQAVKATPIVAPTDAPGPFRVGWIAEDGARVAAGEEVIRFDPSEAEKQLVEAEDTLRETRLRLDKQDVEAAAQLSQLERDAAMARLELEKSSRFQKRDELIFSRGEIIESEIDQTLAETREAHARDAKVTKSRLAGAERSLLAIDLRQAEHRIARAKAALAALSVTAPHAGVFVVARGWRGEPVRLGDTVWNNQPLGEIPDLAKMEAEVFVLEADAGGLAPGKPATLVVESAPERVYRAKISRTDAIAKPQVRGSPVQYFAVTLALDETDPQVMKPGQRVRATLTLDQRKGALAVPRQAVFEERGRLVAYRLKDRDFLPVPVELGPGGAGRVVVEKGLQPGDVIALVDPTKRAGPEATPSKPTPRSRRPGPAGDGDTRTIIIGGGS
jgi:multidrug resistance efflux pump